MSQVNLRVVLSSLFLAGVGAVSLAAPSLHSSLKKAVHAVQADINDEPGPYQWMLPSVIQAGLNEKGASIDIGEAGASFKGRRFEMKHGQFTYGITDYLQVYYGEQFFLAKGRSSGSRFDVADNYYGIKGIVKRPTAKDPTSVAVEFQAIRPDSGSARLGGAGVVYAGPHNNVFAVDYQDRKAIQYQLKYTDVTVPGGSYAHVYSAGLGHDYRFNEVLLARIQGSLVAQSYSANAEQSNYELKPVIYGALAITPYPWCSIEADVTAYPGGTPIASGELTGMSSFDLYSPGGVVDQLRHEFVAFASIRLMFHGKF